jgi:hypothetical protein
VRDGVRLRGGFSVNGGMMSLPNTAHIGPAFGFGMRLGVQFNHHFGLVYQNTPMATFTYQMSADGTSGSVNAGFVDYNSLLATLTLFHMLDIGAGPSLDYLAVANASESPGMGLLPIPMTTSSSSSGLQAGAHGRVALHVGGLSGNGPRRSGFAIGVDAHPIFTGPAVGVSFTGGFGAEWY